MVSLQKHIKLLVYFNMFSQHNTSANLAYNNPIFIVKGRFSLAPGVNVIMPVCLAVIPVGLWAMLFYKGVLSLP